MTGGEKPKPPPEPGSAAETELVERLTRAFESSSLDGLVALLADDVWLRMPPVPLEYCGRDLAARFFAAVAFRPGRRFRMVATRANHRPALITYLAGQHAGVPHANGIIVLTLAGNEITEPDPL